MLVLCALCSIITSSSVLMVIAKLLGVFISYDNISLYGGLSEPFSVDCWQSLIRNNTWFYRYQWCSLSTFCYVLYVMVCWLDICVSEHIVTNASVYTCCYQMHFCPPAFHPSHEFIQIANWWFLHCHNTLKRWLQEFCTSMHTCTLIHYFINQVIVEGWILIWWFCEYHVYMHVYVNIWKYH